MRTIGVVTVGRSDFGIYTPILRAIERHPQLRLDLYVSGAHLSPEFGRTLTEIEQAGFQPSHLIETLLSGDSPEAIGKSMGLGTIGFAQALARRPPDVLLVLGDRFDMLAAALAAAPHRIPLAHVHGGEATVGAIDEVFRHALTKLSHLHFAATEEFARRIIQLGEEPWRVTVCGAPALDQLRALPDLPQVELEQRVGLVLDRRPLVVTYHPETLRFEQAERQVGEVIAALEAFAGPIVVTKPNADTGGRAIIRAWERLAATRPHVRLVDNLGSELYFQLLRRGAAMVGNSSSGIIEAASFRLPVVNIGVRQQGRPRSANVLDVDCRREAIADAIRRATSPEFRRGLQGLKNVYDAGGAAQIIVGRLAATPLDDRLRMKPFYDLPAADSAARTAAA